MLGIGLMLFCLRGMKPDAEWDEKLLEGCFWTMNIGLACMALFTLLPLGALRLWIAPRKAAQPLPGAPGTATG